MNDALAILVVLLVTLTGGAAGFFGGTGPAGPGAGTADLASQETTTQARETTAEAVSETHVEVRNVTVERLTMRNVTVLDVRFDQLTVVNESGENATNRTYQNVGVQRIESTGFVTDLTVENVTVRNESLAEALVEETGRVRVETRLVVDEALLQNRTVNGLVVEDATVHVGATENVSVSQDANATGTDVRTQDPPALSAETAVVENYTLTRFQLSGLSLDEVGQDDQNATTAAGETTGAATGETTTDATAPTTAAPQTTATAEAERTTVGGQTTTGATEVTPAEARSGATDGGTTTSGDGNRTEE